MAQWQQEAQQALQGERKASAKALTAAKEDAARRQQEAAAAQQELLCRLQDAESRLRDPNAAAQVPRSCTPPGPVSCSQPAVAKPAKPRLPATGCLWLCDNGALGNLAPTTLLSSIPTEHFSKLGDCRASAV